ncbi:MAG: ribonuclease Z [Myxococcales bacterium]|nr:ribonuclease Z [Myxococcales bacterium]MCB9700652.1 ribonuclease Z [Myxococcales bacterium]
MSARELVVLGTASQVPTRYRNHNGYFLRWDAEGILFDPGEGTQRQMIVPGVTASMITRICITHFHGDHCLGFASMVQRISLDRVPQTVHVYYPGSGQVYYDRLRRASIFHDVSHIEAHPINAPGELFESGELSLRTLPLDHGVDAWGYRLQERGSRTMLPEKLAAAGLRGPAVGELLRDGQVRVGDRIVKVEEVSVERPGQSMAFIMDTRLCDNAFELARGVDLLVCESTYLDEDADKAHANGHMTAREAAILARDAGARRLVLTHFSQRYQSTKPFVAEAREIHADAVAARDGDTIPVPKRQKAS